MFFLFAGKTIMAAGYSDEELIKIYTDYSDLFKQKPIWFLMHSDHLDVEYYHSLWSLRMAHQGFLKNLWND